MLKAYLDTCIVSGLAKEDLPQSEQAALLDVLRFHKAEIVQLVTSSLVKDEIDNIPRKHRARHEVIYNLLANIPISRVSWTNSGLTLTGAGGGRRVDPLYAELKAWLPDEFDVLHVFQAIKSTANYFVTTDNRTILRHGEVLKTNYGIQTTLPSELARILVNMQGSDAVTRTEPQ